MRIRLEVDVPGNTLTEAIEYAFADPTVLTNGATWSEVDSLTVDRRQATEAAALALLDLHQDIQKAQRAVDQWFDANLRAILNSAL